MPRPRGRGCVARHRPARPQRGGPHRRGRGDPGGGAADRGAARGPPGHRRRAPQRGDPDRPGRRRRGARDRRRDGPRRYLVACDGVHSSLRETVGIGSRAASTPAAGPCSTRPSTACACRARRAARTGSGPCRWPTTACGCSSSARRRRIGERPSVADAQAVIDRHVPGAPRIVAADNAALLGAPSPRHRPGRPRAAGRRRRPRRVSGQGMRHQACRTPTTSPGSCGWPSTARRRPCPFLRGRAPAVAVAAMPAWARCTRPTCSPPGAPRARPVAGRRAGRAGAACWPRSRPATSSAPSTARARWPPGGWHQDARRAPGRRVPDAGPLVGDGGRPTSLRELVRDPEPRLGGTGHSPRPRARRALRERAARAAADDRRPARGRPGRRRGLRRSGAARARAVGAVADAAYVVRPMATSPLAASRRLAGRAAASDRDPQLSAARVRRATGAAARDHGRRGRRAPLRGGRVLPPRARGRSRGAGRGPDRALGHRRAGSARPVVPSAVPRTVATLLRPGCGRHPPRSLGSKAAGRRRRPAADARGACAREVAAAQHDVGHAVSGGVGRTSNIPARKSRVWVAPRRSS